jgi:hypothetical protein
MTTVMESFRVPKQKGLFPIFITVRGFKHLYAGGLNGREVTQSKKANRPSLAVRSCE